MKVEARFEHLGTALVLEARVEATPHGQVPRQPHAKHRILIYNRSASTYRISAIGTTDATLTFPQSPQGDRWAYDGKDRLVTPVRRWKDAFEIPWELQSTGVAVAGGQSLSVVGTEIRLKGIGVGPTEQPSDEQLAKDELTVTCVAL